MAASERLVMSRMALSLLRQCPMKQKPAGTRPSDRALHSLAVAIAIVLFAHPVFWMAGQDIAAAGELGGSAAHFEDQADAPESNHRRPQPWPVGQ